MPELGQGTSPLPALLRSHGTTEPPGVAQGSRSCVLMLLVKKINLREVDLTENGTRRGENVPCCKHWPAVR